MRPHLHLARPHWVLPCIAAAVLARGAVARPWWDSAEVANAGDFLPADQAFRVSADLAGRRLTVHWDIARGYYLYRSRIRIRVQGAGRLVSGWRLPPGIAHTDRYFGPQQVYFHAVDASAELARTSAQAAAPRLQVSYQGCAQAGLCYPRIVRTLVPERVAPSSPVPVRR